MAGHIIEEHVVYGLAQRAHHTPEDFCDGDLGERIEQFSHFELSTVRIADLNLNEWQLDDDLVDAYSELDGQLAPPIIYDAVNRSIIDGLHRANAAAKRGEAEIAAYIGREEFLVQQRNRGMKI